jgi:predicted dehydrogenase
MAASSEFVRWGIVGTGNIAAKFARQLPLSRTGRLAAVGSRTPEQAARFAAEHGNVRAHGSYEALLADPAVDAVYIATPHPDHAARCLAAARAGKHLLCEKPLTLNHAEAVAVAEAARAHGVFLMEAFMYRCHPQTARLVELVRGGAVGEVRLIEAAFGTHAQFDPAWRLFNRALGGGAILDLGCYVLSAARLVAGAARGEPFADPVRLTGHGLLHPETGVDTRAIAALTFPGGIVAQLSTSVDVALDVGLHIRGSAGSLHLAFPYVPREENSLFLRRGDGPAEEIVVRADRPLYALEADAVGEALVRGEQESPCMPVADSLGNMAALDAWRAALGLAYPGEPGAQNS